jgi:glycosyltransferase involved in cell wall biosynthesis
MGLTVLNVAFPFARVGPDAAGGAEQILSTLDEGLEARGHHSIVVAVKGSEVHGELLAMPPADATIAYATWDRSHLAYRRVLADVLRTRSIDVVHMHGMDFLSYMPDVQVPIVATLHLPVRWYPESLLRLVRADLVLTCVSESQRRTLPAAPLVPVDVIQNGVAIDRLARRGSRRREFVAVLGRICPEKGVHLALQAAGIAGVPLVIAGQVFGYEEHLEYFRRHIEPSIGPSCRFIGPVGPRRKRRLLSAARCLLVASQAPETSSLVAMEAMACGTPVVAFATGALPEVVEHGVTGFLVRSPEEMADAISMVGRIDPAACRARAVARFSDQRMIGEYIDVYEHLTSASARPQAS